jgi:hypothetical protein
MMPFAHSFVALLVSMPEPSTATLIAALAGAGGAVHIARSIFHRVRSRQR